MKINFLEILEGGNKKTYNIDYEEGTKMLEIDR